MELRVIGIGGAGCRIADALHGAAFSGKPFIETTFAFDTDSEDLIALGELPETRRIRYAPAVENGLNGDLEQGASVGDQAVGELSRKLDDGQPSTVDAFLIVIGFGGATGGGTAPALIKNLQTLYDKPVYVLGTVPAERDENLELTQPDATGGQSPPTTSEDQRLAETNALQTLESLEGVADAIICVDNESWLGHAETLTAGRDRINQAVATRIAALFAATGAGTHNQTDAETVIDANDVSRILGTETGIATLGYGTEQIETDDDSRFGLGLFSTKSSVDASRAISAVETAIGKALRGKLTLECERADADRALLIVGGPPEWLNRTAVADGRAVVESAVGSPTVLSGDAPQPDSDCIFAIVLLAGIEPVDRLDEIRSRVDW